MKCLVLGCLDPHSAKGYCKRHYYRWRRYGDPMRVVVAHVSRKLTIAERLDLLLDKSGGPEACWPYIRKLHRTGYAPVRFHGSIKGVHVWAYEVAFGPVMDGMFVLHACDNRRCGNPAHLSVGTHQDNMNDKVARGRQARMAGEENPFAKLTKDQAIEIKRRRLSGERVVDLVREFGVSGFAIYGIATGKTWAHLAQYQMTDHPQEGTP